MLNVQFFGLIATSVALHGYFNGLHFHQTFYTRLCKVGYGNECPVNNYFEEDVCAYEKSLANQRFEFKQVCPSRWIVVPQVFIIASAWVGTLTVLIVLFTLDISKNKSFALLVSTTAN